MGEKTLYELSEEYLAIRRELSELDTLPPELETRLDANKQALDDKVRSIQRLIMMLEDDIVARKERIDSFEASQKAAKSTIEWLRRYCCNHMRQAGVDRVEEPVFGGVYQIEHKKVLVLGEDIPEDLMKPEKRSPDREVIRALLECEVDCGSAHFEDEWQVKWNKTRERKKKAAADAHQTSASTSQ